MAVGAMPLLVAALLKVTPEGWVDKVNTKKYFDEDQEGESRITAAYGRMAEAKVPTKGL